MAQINTFSDFQANFQVGMISTLIWHDTDQVFIPELTICEADVILLDLELLEFPSSLEQEHSYWLFRISPSIVVHVLSFARKSRAFPASQLLAYSLVSFLSLTIIWECFLSWSMSPFLSMEVQRGLSCDLCTTLNKCLCIFPTSEPHLFGEYITGHLFVLQGRAYLYVLPVLYLWPYPTNVLYQFSSCFCLLIYWLQGIFRH